MADTINASITEQSIAVTMTGGDTWNGISGKPTAVSGNSFMVSDSTPFSWLVKTLPEVKTILGLNLAVQTVPFAIPLAIDVTTYKDWKCTSVSGDATLNITGQADGEAGIIELFNSTSGVVTMGTMFTKNAGSGVLATAVSGDNIIAWYKSGSDVIFSISNIG